VVGRTLFTRVLEGFAEDGLRRLTEQAGAAAPAEAATYWSQADRRAMELAVWVPLATGRSPRYHATRVHGWSPTAAFPHGDLTTVWLAG
jgi:hypothetical protein